MPSSEFIKYIGIIIALLVLIILSYVFASGGMENMSKTLCQTSARVRNFWYHSPLINFPIFNIGASTFSHLSGWAPPLFCSPSKKILDLTKSNRTEILDKLAKEILDCYAKYGGDSFDILMDNANNPQLCSIMHLKLGDNKINMSDLVTFLSTYNVTSINARDCRICTNEAGEYCPSGFTCMEDGSVCYQAIKDCNIEKFPGIKFCPCPKDFSCSGGTKCVKDSVEIDAPVCYNYTSPYSCRINLTYGDLMRALRIVYVSSNVYGVSTCNMEMKSISCPDGRTYQYHDPIFCGCKEPYSDEGYCLNLTKLKEDGKITDNNDLCKLVQRNLSLDSLCNTYKNDVYEFNCASSISTLMCDDSYGCVEPKLGYSLPIYGFIRDDYTRTLYNFTDDILTGEIDLFLFFSDHFIRSLLESGNAKLSDPSFLSSLTYAGRTTYGFTNAFIRYYHSPSVSSYFPMSTTQLTQFQADATTFGFLKTTESYSGNWKKFLRDKSSYFGGIANPPMKYVALTALSGSFTAASTRVPIAFNIPPICGGGCGHTAGGWEAWTDMAINCGVECLPCAVSTTGIVYTAGFAIIPILKQCAGCIVCLGEASLQSYAFCSQPRVILPQDSVLLCYHSVNPLLDPTPGCGGIGERCCAGDTCDYGYLFCRGGKCDYYEYSLYAPLPATSPRI